MQRPVSSSTLLLHTASGYATGRNRPKGEVRESNTNRVVLRKRHSFLTVTAIPIVRSYLSRPVAFE